MTNHFCQFQFLNPRVYCSPYLDIFLGCDTWLINPILDTGASRSSFPRLWTMTALPVAPSQGAPSCGGFFSWLFFYSLSRRSSTSVVPIPGLKTTPLAAWPHRWPPAHTSAPHLCLRFLAASPPGCQTATIRALYSKQCKTFTRTKRVIEVKAT